MLYDFVGYAAIALLLCFIIACLGMLCREGYKKGLVTKEGYVSYV